MGTKALTNKGTALYWHQPFVSIMSTVGHYEGLIKFELLFPLWYVE